MLLNEKGIYKWVSDPKIQSVLLKEIFSGMVVIRGLRWAVWVINLNLSAKRIGSSVLVCHSFEKLFNAERNISFRRMADVFKEWYSNFMKIVLNTEEEVRNIKYLLLKQGQMLESLFTQNETLFQHLKSPQPSSS